MSIAALNWAKHVTVGDAMRKSILFVLADYADEQGSCFPSQGTIAEQSEAGERTVRRVLAEFEERGIISHRQHRPMPEGRGRSSDRIFLNLEWSHLQPAVLAGKTNRPERHIGQEPNGQTGDQPARQVRPTGHSLADDPLENHQVEPRRSASRSPNGDWRDAVAPTVGRNLTTADHGYGDGGYQQADPEHVAAELAAAREALGPRRRS